MLKNIKKAYIPAEESHCFRIFYFSSTTIKRKWPLKHTYIHIPIYLFVQYFNKTFIQRSRAQWNHFENEHGPLAQVGKFRDSACVLQCHNDVIKVELIRRMWWLLLLAEPEERTVCFVSSNSQALPLLLPSSSSGSQPHLYHIPTSQSCLRLTLSTMSKGMSGRVSVIRWKATWRNANKGKTALEEIFLCTLSKKLSVGAS